MCPKPRSMPSLTTSTATATGDEKVKVIGAASIIAKVYRDSLMMKFDKQYPDFYFSSHKGYGTKLHKAAIKKYGITPIHRKTFKGVVA